LSAISQFGTSCISRYGFSPSKRHLKLAADRGVDADRRQAVHRAFQGEAADELRPQRRPSPFGSLLALAEVVFLGVVEVGSRITGIIFLGRQLEEACRGAVSLGSLQDGDVLEIR
jgi:hypothetical protein